MLSAVKCCRRRPASATASPPNVQTAASNVSLFMPNAAFSGRSSLSDEDDLVSLMMAMMPPYEGTDPNTSVDWYCKSCCNRVDEEGVTSLKKFGRCRLAKYCSSHCQRADYKEHKEDCIELERLRKETQRLSRKLQACDDILVVDNEGMCNLFRTHVGQFWGILETRDYCRARAQLAAANVHMGHEYEVAPLLEVALRHQLGLLRLIVSDNLGLRNEVVFTLLRLNRDRACVAFVEHWVKSFQEEDHERMVERHRAAGADEWFYGEGDIRFDFLDVVGRNGEALYQSGLSRRLAYRQVARCCEALQLPTTHFPSTQRTACSFLRGYCAGSE